MLGQANTVSYKKLKTAMENDILNRFPTIAKHINAINIDKNHFSGDLRSAGFAINTDSNVCSKATLHRKQSELKFLMQQRHTLINRWILL